MRSQPPGAVAVIGAGPNGLAVAAHLRARGVTTVCFGEPLEFWQRGMPAGMLLRSSKRSSHIADPARALTIDDYARRTGRSVRTPNLELRQFIDYGLWYASQAVPEIDPRRVSRVRRRNGGFALQLADGSETLVDRLVVAAGLSYFPRRLPELAGLSDRAVSHAADHADLGPFGGRQVAVIGGGQSAIESAALLSEAGAEVEVLLRAPGIRWLAEPGEPPPPRRRRPGVRIPLPPTDIGGGGARDAWVAALPDIFRRLDPARQERLAYRCIRPAASGWLRPRTASVRISTGRRVVGAREAGDGRVALTLNDESERVVDHVLLGTGYAIDVRRYPFFGPDLAGELVVADGSPVLGRGLESSIPGLHFVGAPAAHSFGPIMRFVVGSWYAAPAVTRRALGLSQPPLRSSF